MPNAPITEPPAKRRKTGEDINATEARNHDDGQVRPIQRALQPIRGPAQASDLPIVDEGKAKAHNARGTVGEHDAQPSHAIRNITKAPAPLGHVTVDATLRDVSGRAMDSKAEPEPAPKPPKGARKGVTQSKKAKEIQSQELEDVDDSFIAGLRTKQMPAGRKKGKVDVDTQPTVVASVAEEIHALVPAIKKRKQPVARKKKIKAEDEAVMEHAIGAQSSNGLRATETSSELKDRTQVLEEHASATAKTDPPVPTKKQPRGKRKAMDSLEKVLAAPETVQTTGGPRRQAAKSAVEKVTKGFVEEAGSVDKLRRAPEPTEPQARGRKRGATPAVEAVDDGTAKTLAAGSADALSADDFKPRKSRKRVKSPAPVPGDTQPKVEKAEASRMVMSEGTVSVTSPPKKRRRKESNAAEELDHKAVQPPIKRGRKAAATAKSKKGTQSRQKQPATSDSVARNGMAAFALDGATDMSDECQTMPAPTACLKPVKGVSEPQTSPVAQADIVLAVNTKPPAMDAAVVGRKAAQPKRKASKLKASLDETLLQFTPKKRRPLGETDANRPSLSPGKADRPNPEKQAKPHTKTAKSDMVLTAGQQTEEPKKSKKRSSEDIDWLFSASPPKRVPSKKQREQQTGTKKSRLRFADRACKDMDLDDLLESVAAF